MKYLTHQSVRRDMADQEMFSTDLDGDALTVRFLVDSLVFPDQIRPLEEIVGASLKDKAATAVVFDCARVDHISSSIWGEMVRLKRVIEEQGGKLRITSMSGHVQEAFDSMKLGDVLDT